MSCIGITHIQDQETLQMTRIVSVRPNATLSARYLNMTTDNRADIHVEKKIHNKGVRVIPGEGYILGGGGGGGGGLGGIDSIGPP